MLKLKKRVREINYKYSSLSGQISSQKMLKAVQFESSLERDLIYLLEFERSVVNYLEQPIKINYKDSIGKSRSYTPDFLICYLDNYKKDELIEVKYEKDIRNADYDLKAKFEAARLFCIKNNILFRVITEKHIRNENKTLLNNIKFLSRYRDYFERQSYKKTGIRFDTTDCIKLLDKLAYLKTSSAQELVNGITDDKYKKAELIFLTWYLVANNFIECDLHSWLNLDSKLWIN